MGCMTCDQPSKKGLRCMAMCVSGSWVVVNGQQDSSWTGVVSSAW